MTIPRPLFLAALALRIATIPLAAQVTYVREIEVNLDDAVLALPRAPVDTSDPLYELTRI